MDDKAKCFAASYRPKALSAKKRVDPFKVFAENVEVDFRGFFVEPCAHFNRLREGRLGRKAALRLEDFA